MTGDDGKPDLPTSGTHVALCSGGRESTVAAHVAIRWGPCDIMAYLDTGTGAESNKRYVERLADELGVTLFTIRTPEDYGDLVREDGFPGTAMHPKMYRCLKERQLGRLATLTNGRGETSDLHLWTGVRLRESRKRMQHVSRVQEADRWTWVAPIYDWTAEDVQRYHRRMTLPTNHLWSTLGRSGDCFCGAFGSPEELIDAEAAGCTRLVDQLRTLENEIGRDDEMGRWGWGALSESEQRAIRAENDAEQMMLCSTCGEYPVATDGGTGRNQNSETGK
jgi:3'-phosphoadenosine 5'-phosphosulfate sulfotransferase (PAPS reductase)/FAD synthetase